jgi:hypothetical protein
MSMTWTSSFSELSIARSSGWSNIMALGEVASGWKGSWPSSSRLAN